MEINKDQLRTWIAALRSGEYKQTDGALEDANGYCCLGVACKVLIPADKLKYREVNLITKFIDGGDCSSQVEAPHWLRRINDDFFSKSGKSLIMLNDEDKLTFDQIANLLEKYYLSDGN